MARALIVEILGDAKQFASELDKAAGKTRAFGKVAAVAGVAVAGTLAVGLEKSVKAAMEAQVQTARLADAFKASGLDMKKYEDGIAGTESAARKLGFTNEDTKAALGRLVAATHDAKESFSDLSVAEDIARFKHISLEAASTQLARAMTGSQRAVKDLGIEVQATKDAQNEAKDKFQEATDALKAQFGPLSNLTQAQRDQYDQLANNLKLQEQMDLQDAKIQDHQVTGQKIIAAVSKELKGQAQAYADTAEGSMAQFHAQVGNIEESLGKLLLPVITKVAAALADFAAWLSAHGPEIRAEFELISAKVAPVLQGIIDLVGAVVDAFRDHWSTIGPIVTQVAKVIGDEIKVIVDALHLVTDLLHGDWAKAWDDAKALVGDAIDGIKRILIVEATIIKDLALAIGTGIKSAVEAGLTGIGQWMSDTVDGIVGFWEAMPGRVAGAIKDGAKDVRDAIIGIFDPLPGVIKDLLGISSPSTVFAEIGQNVVHGFIKGIESMGPELRDKATGLLGSIGGAVVGTASSVGGSIAGAISGGFNGVKELGKLMAASYGWTGGEWAALEALWDQESGWNPRAKNPQSGAYGIPQALPPTKMPYAAQEGGGSSAQAQIAWGLSYIKSRYGDPAAAWGGYWQRGGWYAKGGIFSQPTIIGVGEAGPEAVVPLSRMGGLGGTHITVNLPNYLGNPQEVAYAIRAELVKIGRREGNVLGGFA